MKLLIVRSAQTSTWGSCKVISPNLQKTYEMLPAPFKVSWFDLPIDYKEKELDSPVSPMHELAMAIEAHRPDQLVFVDHLPCPADVLSKLCLLIEPRRLPSIVIHAYGDFTYFSKDWMDLGVKLHGHPIKIISASASQKRLIDFFCEEPHSVETFCFPVNSDDYYFDEGARKELRKKFHIEDQDIVLLYSGRVSLQKNVDMLLQEYLDLLKHENVNVHLWIVGAFDDIGAPFMGVKTTEGYLHSKLQSMLSHHPKHFTKNVKFWGLQDKNELRKIKSAADLFISLSLYHDEDFGMSPAEAIACGLPSLLTDWGGYSSFASSKWRCKLAPVKITEYGLQIKTSTIKELLDEHKESYITGKDRERWAKAFSDEFSIESCVNKLKKILEVPARKFAGFNWVIAPFGQTYGKYALSSSIDPNTCPSSKNFYAQVYKNYISIEESSNDFYKIVQWTYDYIQNAHQETGMPVGRKMRANHFYLKPFSLDYFSPVNPVLLGGYITKKLANKKIWTLRDGVVPVSFFFREHTPENTSGTIAVHKDLWQVVPEEWRDRVMFYDIVSNQVFDSSNRPQKILFAGMGDSTFADEEEFKEELLLLKQKLGDDLSQIKISALFPARKNNLWGRKIDESGLDRAQAIINTLGADVEFIEWNDLKNENNLKGVLYYEINKGHFIKDSYLQYFALSRGAGLLKSVAEKLPLTEISQHPISLHHSVRLYSMEFAKLPAYVDPFAHASFEFFKEATRGQVKSVRITQSWESWYPLFLKKFYKVYGKVHL